MNPEQGSPQVSSSVAKAVSISRRPWWRRVRDTFAGLMGAGLVAGAAGVAAQSAPAHWMAYAQLASNQLHDWLSDAENESATRLYEWGQARLAGQAGTAAPESVVVRLWLDAKGRVERAEFTSLGDMQADADLRQVLTTQPLSEPPPSDMAQPMILQLTLDGGVE
ncbi:hypothetical protein PT7_0264 [Pusillimonas sp. T7-7]|uniref:hypothetical protein n=1 Tax=Pusillimonas sp. (strain T7-7) TaxID=1007105 RepID=UPI0002084AEA|nr:hypothetical protein [Pusillimonas sp. T7-7]AEC18804.1 hypothetical protein PT7_0264 [Pusillimonas sp. T7-7]